MFDQEIEKFFDDSKRGSSFSILITGLGSNNWDSLLLQMRKFLVPKQIKNAGEELSNLILIEPFKKKKSIGIDQIREALRQISLTGQYSAQKAVVVPQANLMNRSAQNALLKVLEEPPKACIFFLGAEFKSQLLPTVVSRCRHLNGSGPTEGDQNIEKENLSNPELEKLYLDIIQKGFAANLNRVDKFFKDEPRKTVDFIKLIISEERRKMRLEIRMGDFASAHRRAAFLKDMAENLREIESSSNTSPKTILQMITLGLSILD